MTEKDAKMVALGNRIRELRDGAGMTRQQLAEAAGVSMRAVVQWELGEREPGWFNMLALAKALAVEITAFLQAPASRPEVKRGRPRKAEATNAPVSKPPAKASSAAAGQGAAAAPKKKTASKRRVK